MTIVRLCGTSGSGKTTVARELMEAADEVVPIGPVKRPEVYSVHLGLAAPLYIIGPYTATCGGVDSLDGWRQAMDLVHRYADRGHVFYESLLMSTYYGEQGKETCRYGKRHIWAFMDTPIEVCIERIKMRRFERGTTKPLNEENTRNRVRTIDRLREKVFHLGHRVEVVPYQKATETVLSWYS